MGTYCRTKSLLKYSRLRTRIGLGKTHAALEVNKAVQLLHSRIAVVVPLNLGTRVCRAPKDDSILGTAIQGDCQCIITGDKDLLALKKYGGINIISPRDFWEYENKVLGKHAPSTKGE